MSQNKIIDKFIDKEITVIVVKSHVFRCPDVHFSSNFVKVTNSKSIININAAVISYIDYFKEEEIYKIAYKSSEMVSGILKLVDSRFIEMEITNFHTQNKYNVVIPIKGIEGVKVHNEDSEE